MPKNTNIIGKLGEDRACEYLVKNGYRILKRNYSEKWDEIDIICRDKDQTIVFVEVKTMNNISEDGIIPEDNMTKSKLRKIKRACESFAAKNQDLINERKGWRIDLLALTINDKDSIIQHYENVI